MATTTIKDFISNQNVKELAQDIVLGPQAEVLTLLEQFNNRWRTHLNITKKFRWRPGTHPEYKKKAAELLHITNKSNSLARIHWRVADSRYYFERMGRQINEIEKKLYDLRNNDLMFQDNTEYVEKALASMLKVAEESEDVWNMNLVELNNGHRQLQIFTIVDTKTIKVRLAEEIIQEIPINPISLNFTIPFDPLLNAHSKIASGDKGRLKINVGVSGIILDNDNQILHPYVSGGNGWGNTRRPSDQYVHTCLGDLTSQIYHAVYTLDWKNVEWLLSRWASNYTINMTNPLNNIKGTYHGKPSFLTEEYMDVVGHSARDCAYPNLFTSSNTIGDVPYCDEIECLLRDDCTFYKTELNISLSDVDEAALYYIAESYITIDDEVMPSTMEILCKVMYSIWMRYQGGNKNVTFSTMYCSMPHMDEKLGTLINYYSEAMRECSYRSGTTYRNQNFSTDNMYPIMSYWALCPGNSPADISNHLPYIREKRGSDNEVIWDRDEEKLRINRLYCMLFDDLNEHLENMDMLDLEPMFEYPYPEVNKIKPIKVAQRQEPIPTTWAEYLANNNLRSIGGQNE